MAKDSNNKTGVDQQMIRELAGLLDETGLTEIEIERAGLKIRVARTLSVSTGAVAAALSAPASASAAGTGDPAAADPADHPGVVKAPMVGTAYLAPEPGAPPFIEIGDRVTKDQTLIIIEAMKTMNHIPAPKGGTVRAILVDNDMPVEFGEPLVIVE